MTESTLFREELQGLFLVGFRGEKRQSEPNPRRLLFYIPTWLLSAAPLPQGAATEGTWPGLPFVTQPQRRFVSPATNKPVLTTTSLLLHATLVFSFKTP